MTVEDLQGESRLKIMRARHAFDLTMHQLAQDVLTSTNWMEIPKAQDAKRRLGEAPELALAAVRAAVPLKAANGRETEGVAVHDMVVSAPVDGLYTGGPALPPTAPVPPIR